MLERPFNSNAANLSVDVSSVSRNSERADVSEMNISVADEETENKSRKLGMPCDVCESSE
jgi:hypothetical protein